MSKVCSKLPRGEKPKASSSFLGVSFCKREGRWRAQIKNGSNKTIGYFDSELAAAHAYNDAAKRLGRPFNLLPEIRPL